MKGNNAFSLAISNVISGNNGNKLVSPVSISTVMGMVHVGARGNTAKQIEKGMNFPDNRDGLYEGYKELVESLNAVNLDVTLETANRIYAQVNYDILPEFHNKTQKHFGASTELVNFANSGEAAQKINTWVKDTTHEKITDLIPADALSGDTRLVLVNAIYFKGDWKQKFDCENTHPQDFHLDDRSVIANIPMMHITDKFPYMDVPDMDAQFLALPYKGERIQMIVILPNKHDGLAKTISKLTSEKLNTIISHMETVKVSVTLPRFKLEATINLEEPLQTLGIQDMFSRDSANFTGISKDGGLFVSKAIQKVFIDVNEEGSEAAAATGMVMMLMCYRPPTPVIQFTADHPFLFAIHDTLTDAIIFFGELVHPTPQSETVQLL